jgi:hypothetical protein
MSDRGRRIKFQGFWASLPLALQSPLRKSWQIILLLTAAFVFAGYGTFFVPQRRDLREADQKFLDALVQKQKRDRDTLPTLVQNIGPGGTIDSANMSVPRAELVVNSAIVKRAELVVRSGKRKRQSITTSLHRSQIPKDL